MSGATTYIPVPSSGPANAVPVATSYPAAMGLSGSQTANNASADNNAPSHKKSTTHTSSAAEQNTPTTPYLTSGSLSSSFFGSTASTGPYQQQQQVPPDTPSAASSGGQANGFPFATSGASASTSTGLVTAVSAGTAGQPKSSKRAIQSCAECKRRKIKCNRVYPCGPCILRGEESLCREVERIEPVHMPVPTMMDFEAACSRIAQLEESMTALQQILLNIKGSDSAASDNSLGLSAGSAASFASHLGVPSLDMLQGPPRAGSSTPNIFSSDRKDVAPPSRSLLESRDRGSHVQSQAADRDPEDMAMMLEDFAMGNRANRDRVAKLMVAQGSNNGDGATGTGSQKDTGARETGGMAGGTVSPTRLPGISEILPPLSTPLLGDSKSLALVELSHPLAGIINADTDYMSKFIGQAPDPLRGWQLVQFYFTHLEWYSRVLHAPTFIEECKHLLSLPPASVSGQVRPSFLAIYFMVLCLSLQFLEPNERKNLGLSTEQVNSLCKTMFSASQSLLWMCDFLGAHSLEHLQCIVLMGVYQYNVGMADSHWALLGSAIKIAQNIGLSRLGNESQKIAWPEAWRDPLRREIGRRVWWHLIFLDWSHATAHNACYSIHPSQNFTDFPANVDDDDMREGQLIHPKPMDVHTDTSFTICRLKFVALYRELVDHQLSHNPPSYSYILDMDTRVVKVLDSLPPYFRGATPPSDHINDAKVMECLLIQLIGETRLLRLHRPYLSRGYKDRKYAPSKDRCVHSARSILVLLKTAEKACPLLLGQWLVLFYGFGAAVVTFIDLCHGKLLGDDVGCRQKRQELREILELLQRARNISDAARSATALLDGLLAAEEGVAANDAFGNSNEQQATTTTANTSSHGIGGGGPTAAGQKRKAEVLDDADPFRKFVKKLLMDASGGGGGSLPTNGSTASPTSSLGGGLTGTSPAARLMPTQPEQPRATPSSSYAHAPVHPPPFQADLDLFMDGSRNYTQFGGASLDFDSMLDPTSADLSHLFVDDIISNLFASDPTLTGDADPIMGSGW